MDLKCLPHTGVVNQWRAPRRCHKVAATRVALVAPKLLWCRVHIHTPQLVGPSPQPWPWSCAVSCLASRIGTGDPASLVFFGRAACALRTPIVTPQGCGGVACFRRHAFGEMF